MMKVRIKWQYICLIESKEFKYFIDIINKLELLTYINEIEIFIVEQEKENCSHEFVEQLKKIADDLIVNYSDFFEILVD